MISAISSIEQLYNNSLAVVHDFENLPNKDTRRKHIEILHSQISTSLLNLKINARYQETNKVEFESLFSSDPSKIESYIHFFTQNCIESIFETVVFQTELVFRFYYSKLTGIAPGGEKNINKIIANLYDDVENKWQKEETKLIILLWTIRNTIHTGGIYYKKVQGRPFSYKGQEYKFEYAKSPDFLRNDFLIISLISDLICSLKNLFESNLIKKLGSFEHPSYYALGN